jgi:uncharacterized OB-fold protein
MSDMSKKLAGTPITGSEWDKGKYFFRTFETDLKYSWDDGVAISHFLEELKEARIVGRRCNHCNRTLVPPRMFCEQCFRATDEWVQVKETGTINTFSVSYVNNDASRREQPLLVAVINIDGASQGMGFLHLLGEVDPSKVYVGMNVRAVWKPKEHRTGAITDILYFKPVGGV